MGEDGIARLAERQGVEPGSAEELVVDLLRAQRPYRLPLGRWQRVGASLAETRRRHRAPLGPPMLRPAVILAVVLCLCGGAFASARILGWPRWIAERYERLVAPAPESAAPAPAPVHATVHTRVPVAASRTPEAAASPSVAPPAAPAVSVAPRAAPAGVPPARRHEPGRSKLALEEDDAPVLAALRALRRAHDPVRARALLEAYLREHPDGTLAEEALAITIEAAAAHHDADAGALAARYLKRYPRGPFRALARRTLGLPAGP